MEHIDSRKMLDLLDKVVGSAGPDHTYDRTRQLWGEDDLDFLDRQLEVLVDPVAGGTCGYFYADGSPACIVGQVLSIVGVTAEETGYANLSSVGALVDELELPWTDDAIRVAMAAQNTQDRGRSWGEALREARRVAEVLSISQDKS